MARKVISLENTRFIHRTNFQGDPERDKYHSAARQATIVIPDPLLAEDMIDDGFNVKMTRPREGEEEGYIPAYYVKVFVNYAVKWPPKVYLVTGNNPPVLLDEESIKTIDEIRVKNVNVVLTSREWSPGKYSLYVKTMYVEQDLETDPFAARYARRNDDDEYIPFN